MSKLFYFSPVWRGYLNSYQIQAIHMVLIKAFLWQLCSDRYNVDGILNNNDSKLFHKLLSENHCLHNVVPLKLNTGYNLRPHGHPFHITSNNYSFTKKCSIIRVLLNMFNLVRLFLFVVHVNIFMLLYCCLLFA